jgi:hypothetical protein
MGDLSARWCWWGRDCVCACGGHVVEAGTAPGANVKAGGGGVVSESVMGVCGHLCGRRGFGRTFWGVLGLGRVVVMTENPRALALDFDANRANNPHFRRITDFSILKQLYM